MKQLDLIESLLRDDLAGDPATASALVAETFDALPRSCRKFGPDCLRAVRPFLLPVVPGRPASSPDTADRTVDINFNPKQEGDRIVLNVAQSHALAVRRDDVHRFWFTASMSECALMRADGPDWTVFAHVSFSYTYQARAACDLAASLGCTPTRAVCPDAGAHANSAMPGDQPRMMPEDWRALGYTTDVFDARHHGGGRWTGLARPLALNDTMYLLRADCTGWAKRLSPLAA